MVTNADKMLKEAGLEKGGTIQQFHTQNVMNRMIKYMSFRTGATIKTMAAQTDIRIPEIILETPYALFLYHGKVMVGVESGKAFANKGEKKVVTSKDLTYDTSKNALAGDRWLERMAETEGGVLLKDLQAFSDSRRI